MNCMDLLLQMATCFLIFIISKIGSSAKQWPKAESRKRAWNGKGVKRGRQAEKDPAPRGNTTTFR